MKKPSKPPQSEHSLGASERATARRFSLPSVQNKLSAKIQAALMDGLAKGLSRDLVSERENLVTTSTAKSLGLGNPTVKIQALTITNGHGEKQQQQQKIARGGAARGRKSIATLMPSRDLVSNMQQFNSMVPLINKYQPLQPPPTRDAYSFKSTSSDEDTSSSFTNTAATGLNSDADTSFTSNHQMLITSNEPRKRSRSVKEASLAPSDMSSATTADSDNTRSRRRTTSVPAEKKSKSAEKELSKKFSKSTVELLPPAAVRATPRRKSAGLSVLAASSDLARLPRKSVPAQAASDGDFKRRPSRKSAGFNTPDSTVSVVKSEPAVARQPRRSVQGDKEKAAATARSRSRRVESSKRGKAVVKQEAAIEDDQAAAAAVAETATKASDEEEEENEELDKSTDDIELEYKFLQKGHLNIKKVAVCALCEMADSGVRDCEGSCQRAYHPLCLGIIDLDAHDLPIKCPDCSSATHSCFACKQVGAAQDPVRKCSHSQCTLHYHERCVRARERLFRREPANGNGKSTFVCPAHACRTCWNESLLENAAQSHNKSMIEETDEETTAASSKGSTLSASALALKAQKGKLVKCIRCPTSYHSNERCLAAGCVALGGTNILCPNHFKPIKREINHKHLNVNWCFACCQPGELIGCNKCPAAYHYECIENAPPELLESFREFVRQYKIAKEKKSKSTTATTTEPTAGLAVVVNGDSRQHSPSSSSVISSTTTNGTSSTAMSLEDFNWTCDECLADKRPCYGDVVWGKVGMYRWWPGQIVHPRNLPDRLREKWYQVGEFPVKFFGTHDHSWLTIGRCFTFAPDDDIHGTILKGSAFLLAFKRGVTQAKLACTRLLDLKRAELEGESASKRGGGAGGTLKKVKQEFQYIRTNRPYGNVVIHRIPIADYPHCECDPKAASPCSTDDCVNRALKYECHPARCPAGDRCQNQRFAKRQYPKQAPLHTQDRGTGLIAKQDIKKGEFVNEYVGELIDDDECKRRLHDAYLNDVRNFYFLTIDQGRIIDAGPKGNLARFMNHSCEPNVETQKWMVNGDVRVGLFALTDIAAGTELTFNYNLDCLSNEKAVCRCGAKNCSGFIGDRPKNNSNNNAAADQSNGGGNPRKRKLSEAATQSTASKSKKTVNGASATNAKSPAASSSRRKSLSAVTLKSTK